MVKLLQIVRKEVALLELCKKHDVSEITPACARNRTRLILKRNSH